MSAGEDDHPQPVAQRWTPYYSASDFVPDTVEPFARLAKNYDTLGTAGATAKGDLSKVVPKSWTGPAAGAFAGYISQVSTYIDTVVGAMGGASKSTTVAGSAVSDALTDAGTATSKANEAQDDHRTQENNKRTPGYQSSPFSSATDTSINQSLADAVRNGNSARGAALTASQTLAKALDAPDSALVKDKEPQLPNLASLSGADAKLLGQIFAPVSAALAKDGDTDRSRSAVAMYELLLNTPFFGKRMAMEYLAQCAKTMSPAELNYLLDHLTADDLAAGLGSLDPKKDRDIYNAIAGAADPSILASMADDDPNHYWHPATGAGDNYTWHDPNAPSDGLPTSDLDSLHQGALGDCHDLASLAALEKSDPNFLKNHVRRNPNGTYTVTLYKDGKPVEVTVTPDVPYNSNADGSFSNPGYAHDGDSSDATLYGIYEKALGQTNSEFGSNNQKDGYDGLNGGNPANDLRTLTGQEGNFYGKDDVNPSDIQNGLDNHKPVTVCTLSDNDAKHSDLYDPNRVPHLIAGHCYYVDHIDPNTHAVTLVNPWGRESSSDGTVTVSWDDYKKSLAETEVGK